MKVGETVAVNIGAASVANAKISEIDTENNLVTLVIPATKVIMSYRTELDTTPTAPSQGNEHAILGVEQNETPPNPIAGLPPVEGVAPVAETVETAVVTPPDTTTPSIPADAVTPAQPAQDASVEATPAVTASSPPVAVQPVAETAVTQTPEA